MRASPTFVMPPCGSGADLAAAPDPHSEEALVRCVGPRLERLARRLLRGYPAVRRHEQPGDVAQGTLLRLVRAVRRLGAGCVRDVFALAALCLRRELVDLARYYSRPSLVGPGPAVPLAAASGGAGRARAAEPMDRRDAPDDLERWTALHEQTTGLPRRERAVFMLAFYRGWSQVRIAAVLALSPRQVRRHWRSACLLLQQALSAPTPRATDGG